MSAHLLVIEHDGYLPGPVHPDQCIYPEHPDERSYTIVCIDPQRCVGWSECSEPHEIDGSSASCGPYQCDRPDDQPSCLGDEPDEGLRPRPPWYDQEEFEFHGVVHTWRLGWGWTVPYQGCIVVDAERPSGADDTPIGVWEIDEEWFDESSCYLEFTTSPPTPAELVSP